MFLFVEEAVHLSSGQKTMHLNIMKFLVGGITVKFAKYNCCWANRVKVRLTKGIKIV